MTDADQAACGNALVLIDTCVFMEHQPIEQLPWLRLLEVNRCRLVIPAVVCRELNNQKDHPKSDRKRDRSRAALSRLSAAGSSATVVSDGVELAVEFREAATATFEEERLNPTIADEHIVARAVEVSVETGIPRAAIAIASSDTPMLMKAKGHGFRAVDLSEVGRLPPEKSEHQAARERAERRLAEIESARPSFTVHFADGTTEMALKNEPIASPSEAERERIFHEELCRAAGTGNLFAARAFVNGDPGLVRRVQGSVQPRVVQLEREERWRAIEARLTHVRVLVTNTTEFPATRLEVGLWGKSEGTFCLEGDLANLRPQVKPKHRLGYDSPPAAAYPELDLDDGVLLLKKSYPTLLAKGSLEVLSVFIYFEKSVPHTTELTWQVHCSELPGPQRGRLILQAGGG